MPDYLTSLDPEQLKACLAPPVPTRILAGAGSGKTRLLISRIANQIETGVTTPEKMFVSAFTRSAADEMDERIRQIVSADQLVIRTFHGLMYGLLNDELRSAGKQTLNVCKPSEQQRILQGILGKKSKDWPDALNLNADLSAVQGYIGTWKNELIHCDSQEIKESMASEHYGTDMYAAALAYKPYEEHLASIGKLDFDDMLCKTYDLLVADKGARDRARLRWDSFSVDEAQDSNRAQMEILKLIAPPEGNPNVTLVGDVKQALYRFRGAVPELMNEFAKVYKAQTLVLDKNYRSSSEIINAANQLGREFKEPQRPHRGSVASPIGLSVSSDMEQAVEIASFVQASRDAGRKGGDTAVLIRTNAQSAEIERAFVAARLPYWCAGGGFFEHMEIGDLMGYLRLAADHTDANALGRIINRPTRYLGRAFVDQVARNSSDYGGDLVTAIRFTTRYAGKKLWAKQLDAAQELSDLLERITPADGSLINARQAIQTVLKSTDYLEWLRTTSGTSEGADDSRKENIDALMEIASDFGSIASLLKFADEAQELQVQSKDATEICTVHRSKGREWPFVIVTNFYQDSFPHKHAVSAVDLADERRVAYVAFTRAQDQLVVMVPEIDIFGKSARPSPFLRDAQIPLSEPDASHPWWSEFF